MIPDWREQQKEFRRKCKKCSWCKHCTVTESITLSKKLECEVWGEEIINEKIHAAYCEYYSV